MQNDKIKEYWEGKQVFTVKESKQNYRVKQQKTGRI